MITVGSEKNTIKGIENITEIFSIFHDGSIADFEAFGDELLLTIEIRYLAERINPGFSRFKIKLTGIESIYFSTWPDDLDSEAALLFDINTIFTSELEVLEGNVNEDHSQIVCNQHSPDLDYCGGELYLKTKSALVSDESGKNYSIEELRALSKAYWDEWAS